MSRRQMILERRVEGEHPDPVPFEVPGMERPLTLREEMRRFVREEISRAAVQTGLPSFEEEDDFEVDDDDTDFTTKYTLRELVEENQVDDLEGNADIQEDGGSRSEPVAPPPPGDRSVATGGEAAGGTPEEARNHPT